MVEGATDDLAFEVGLPPSGIELGVGRTERFRSMGAWGVVFLEVVDQLLEVDGLVVFLGRGVNSPVLPGPASRD